AVLQVRLDPGEEVGRQRRLEVVGQDRDHLLAGHGRPPKCRVSCSRSAIRARCRRDFTDASESPTIDATSSFDSSSSRRLPRRRLSAAFIVTRYIQVARAACPSKPPPLRTTVRNTFWTTSS